MQAQNPYLCGRKTSNLHFLSSFGTIVLSRIGISGRFSQPEVTCTVALRFFSMQAANDRRADLRASGPNYPPRTVVENDSAGSQTDNCMTFLWFASQRDPFRWLSGRFGPPCDFHDSR